MSVGEMHNTMALREKKGSGTSRPANTPDSSTASSVGYDEAAMRRKLRSAIVLLAIFCTVYFVGAMIATPEFAHIARIEIASLPVAFYTGILVFVAGIIVTRMCLNLDKGE